MTGHCFATVRRPLLASLAASRRRECREVFERKGHWEESLATRGSIGNKCG